MADTTPAAAAAAAAAPVAGKPPKPDEALYKEELAKAEKEHAQVMAKYNEIKAKIDSVVPNKDAPNPKEKRRKELLTEVSEIRKQQGVGKNARGTKLDQIKRLDEQMRSRINEAKNARGKVAFKSAEDIDREIERLDKQVNTGMMKLVDEKKALAEISSLRKTRKNFSQFDNDQKQIDDLKAKIKEIKDSMEDPEARALSDKYTEIQTELDAIKAEQDEVYKNLSNLRDEKSKLHSQQQEKYQAMRKIRDDYFQGKRAFFEYEREAKQRAWERQKGEREKYEKEKKKERAQKMLTEASDPAYMDEIRRANSLLHFFDPSHTTEEKAPLLASSGLTAEAQRKVDGSDLKGAKIISKKDREDDYFAPVKKGKKGKKQNAGGSNKSAYNCPPSVMEDCAFMGIDPPMSAADVPAVAEKVKAKLDHWKSDQAAQTQRNVDKAKKEIEKLEADEAEEANGTATPNGKVNGKKSEKSDKSDDKAVAEVTTELKDATIEDKENKEEVAA